MGKDGGTAQGAQALDGYRFALGNEILHPNGLSWTQSATPGKSGELQSSKLNVKITQVKQVTRPARDPEKQGARATRTHDQASRDQQWEQAPKASRVIARDKTRDKSRDPTRFGYAKNPLINKWQTVGTVNRSTNHHMTRR